MTASAAPVDRERREQLRSIVLDVLELEDHELDATDHFVDDHGADSLNGIEILARIEREFAISIPAEALGEMSSLENVYAVVARHAGWVPRG
jgi:acyl carrier protein